MILAEIERQGSRAEDGAWVKDIPGAGDLELRVRAIGNAEFVKLRADLYAAEAPENKPRGVLNDEASNRHSVELLAKTVLLGWNHLTDANKKQIPYSVELATKLLSEPRSFFRRYVSWAADNVAHLGEMEVKEAKGN